MEPSNRWSTSSGGPPRSPEEALATGADQDARVVVTRELHEVRHVRQQREVVLGGLAEADARVEPQRGDPGRAGALGHARRGTRRSRPPRRRRSGSTASPSSRPGGAWPRSRRRARRPRRPACSTRRSARSRRPRWPRARRDSFCVSTETGPYGRSASMTGTTRANSSSASTGVAPGRVDSPPTSTTSQPASKCARPRATASSVASVRESGKNESGVTFTMPMTAGLSATRTDAGG